MLLKNLRFFALAVALFTALVFAAGASAQSAKKTKKLTTTITQTETESEGDEEEKEVAKPADEPTEKIMTATFGSKAQSGTAGCKTEALIKQTVKDLKGDCKAWIKDQKADLKSKFLTSSCEEKCEDCGMSLQRCLVTGTITYTVK